MKCTIPEISWHNRDPVLSVDVQPVQPSENEGFYRLASAGTDSHVLIWHLKIIITGAVSLEPVSDLTRHQRAVNVVRWSHSGQYLASGDDDANIIIWHQKPDDLAIMLDGDNNDKEKWNVLKVLRGHKEDVYDICWSPDSSKLISGSVDNTAIIWDLNKGLNDNILTDHKGFVQGVSWDPLGQYVATLSSDRTFRIFTDTGKQVKARISKGQVPVQESHYLNGQTVRYFHDDTLKTFYRRLSFSPDGNLIITPAGCLEMGEDNNKLYSSYIFTINSLSQPAAILPSPGQYTIAIRFCPILFQLHQDGPDPVITLPYRMIFAVATRSSVILYDTQQMSPFAIISNIHYTRLTDVTWSIDGRILTVSSTDGFCSIVTFEPNELGIEYVKEPEIVEQEPVEMEAAEEDLNISVDKDKKPSFLEKWTKKIKNEDNSIDKMEVDDDVIVEAEKENKKQNIVATEVSKKEKTPGKSPAKPIAVRRKPKNDQMNITQFLKSPKVSKEVENKTNVKDSKPDTIVIDSLDELPTPHPIISIEDNSQNIKLVLEDTVDQVPQTTNDKMEVDESNTNDHEKHTNEENICDNKLENETESVCLKNDDLPNGSDKLDNKECPSTSNSSQEVKNIEKPSNLTNVLSVPKDSPAKKRIPLITLSSPKQKKKLL